MTPLLLDGLRARARVLLALTFGLVALSVAYLAIYPQLEGQLQAFAGDLPEVYDALLGDADITTPEGYVRSQVFSLVAPLLVSGVAIGAGASLARAERDLTLGATYAAPVHRRTLAGARVALVAAVALLGGVAVVVGVVVGAPLAGADVALDAVVAATVPLVGLALFAGAVAWAVGAATGAPGAALGAGWALVGLSFVANSAGALVGDLAWLTDASPWGWYGAGAALTEGFDPASLLLFAGAAVAVVLGLVAFDRRDLHL